MTLDASAATAVEHGQEHDHSSPSVRALSVGGQAAAESSAGSSPSASSTSSSSCSLADRLGLETSLQRSRSSASPRCFGARGRKRKESASRRTVPKDDVVSTRLAGGSEESKGRRQRKSRRSPPGARSGKASESGSSSPASSVSSSSLRDQHGLRTSQPPCFGTGAHGNSGMMPRGSSRARAREPGKKEETKGSGVGSYLREISRRLMRGAAEKSPPRPATRTARPVGERKRGNNAIASEEEMRAFVIASARNIERNGPPIISLGLV